MSLTHDDVLIAHVEQPSEPLRIVALCDPALDTDRLGGELRAQYAATLDPSILPVRAGKQPIVFHVTALSAGESDDLAARVLGASVRDGDLSLVEVGQRTMLAYFERGVVKAESVPQWSEKRGAYREDVTDRDVLRRLPRPMRQEIGRYIQRLSESPKAPAPKDDAGK